jgi:hypothetical protein
MFEIFLGLLFVHFHFVRNFSLADYSWERIIMLCCTAASAIKPVLCQLFKMCYTTVNITIFAPYRTIQCT